MPTVDFKLGSDYVMHCMDEFDNYSRSYQFTPAQKFLHFRESLSHNERQTWDSMVPANQTNNTFRTTRTNFLKEPFPPESYQNFLDYIGRTKKPVALNARKLKSRMQTLFRYASKLPDGAVIEDREQRRLFIQMFPQSQITELKRIHPDYMTKDLSDLAEFFTTFETPDVKHTGKRSRGNDRENTRNTRYRGRNGRFYSRRSQYSSGQQQTGTNNRNDRNRNGNHQRQGQGQNQGQRQGQDPNMCRIHAHLGDRNHKWSDCIYNPRSQNYRPDLRPPDRRSNQSNQSNQNQNQQQQQQAPAAGQYMTQFPLQSQGQTAQQSYFGQSQTPGTPSSVQVPNGSTPSNISVVTNPSVQTLPNGSSQPPNGVPNTTFAIPPQRVQAINAFKVPNGSTPSTSRLRNSTRTQSLCADLA